MLNHVRTLLLDRPDDADPALPGEELVAAGYRPAPPPAALAAVRRVLFGADPDRLLLNYRLRQLLAVVHASPLEPYVTAPDPRITYLPFAADLLDPALYLPRVTPTGSTPADAALTVSGAPLPPDAAGRAEFAFAVTVLAGGAVRVDRLRPDPLNTNSAPPAPLVGSGYAVTPGRADAGLAWLVEVRNRPQYDPGALVASAATLGEPVLAALFGTADAEPYRTFRNLWRDGRETPLRLAALVLALAYRTDEARQARG